MIYRARNKLLLAISFALPFLAGAFASPSPASAAIVSKITSSTGLVGYWSFNEGTSTTANDYSGGKNKGTLAGANGLPTWTSGKLGKALSFDGVDDYVSTGDLSGSVPQNGPATISGWYYFNTSALARGSSMGLNSQLYQHVANNYLYIGGGGADYFNVASALTLTTWHHIVLTYTGTHENDLLYIDGVKYTVNIQSAGTNHQTLSNFAIGAINGPTYFFSGKIDDVRVYNRVLTQAEVLSIYKENATAMNATQGNKLTSGLVGYWSFNGPDIDNTYIYDRSGSANHGYLYNVATSSAKAVGKVGQALIFDGVNDYIQSRSNLGISGDAAFTMCAWIYWSEPVWRLVGSGYYPSFMGNNSTGVASQGLSFTMNDGKPAIDFWNNRFQATSALNVRKWYHLCGTKSPGLISTQSTIYVNGASVAGSGAVTTPNITDSPAIIGRLDTNGNHYFSGKIDEPRFYNRVLSAAEAKQLYLMGR